MTVGVFVAVMTAALIHASWNALIKSGADKFGNMVALVLGHAPAALVLVWFVPLPARESWGLVGASVALHLGYQLFLLLSYRVGDLSHVYPIARGAAPLIIALFSITTLSHQALLGVLLVAGGITIFGLVQAWGKAGGVLPFVLALVTGCFIASYSIIDARAVEIGGTVLGFYAWQSLINILIYMIFVPFVRAKALVETLTINRRAFLWGGAGSFAAYSIVLWAFTQAPIALVTAMRETSVLFALLIGVLFLAERFTVHKAVLTLVVLAGLILLRLSG